MRKLTESNLSHGDSSQYFLDKERVTLFSKQFSALRTELYSYLVSRIGGDIASAEDCLQEVALVLWNKHDPNWEAQDYRRYAYRCASIEIQAHHRKNQKSKKQLTYLAPDTVESLSAEVLKCEQEDAELPLQRLTALKTCMSKLTPDQKELLEARYNKKGSSHTITDLAEHHGWKIDTIYKRLERLRTSLYQCISKRINQRSS